MTERLFAVGPSLGIHLKHSKIDTELDLLDTITALEFSNNDLTWFVVPMLQEMRNVEVHGANMAARFLQVNAM